MHARRLRTFLIAVVTLLITVVPVFAQVGQGDDDGDGVYFTDDHCPTQPGSKINHGCPDTPAADADSDGVADFVDQCPNQAGTGFTNGCPTDATGVPVPNSPQVVMIWQRTDVCMIGVPLTAESPVNVRSDPSLTDNVIGALFPGDQVEVLYGFLDGEGNRWFKEVGGWVSDSVVIDNGMCGDVPNATDFDNGSGFHFFFAPIPLSRVGSFAPSSNAGFGPEYGFVETPDAQCVLDPLEGGLLCRPNPTGDGTLDPSACADILDADGSVRCSFGLLLPATAAFGDGSVTPADPAFGDGSVRPQCLVGLMPLPMSAVREAAKSVFKPGEQGSTWLTFVPYVLAHGGDEVGCMQSALGSLERLHDQVAGAGLPVNDQFLLFSFGAVGGAAPSSNLECVEAASCSNNLGILIGLLLPAVQPEGILIGL